MKAIRKSSEAVETAVAQLTAQNSVISKMGSAETAKSLDTTVKNLEQISQGLLTMAFSNAAGSNKRHTHRMRG